MLFLLSICFSSYVTQCGVVAAKSPAFVLRLWLTGARALACRSNLGQSYAFTPLKAKLGPRSERPRTILEGQSPRLESLLVPNLAMVLNPRPSL